MTGRDYKVRFCGWIDQIGQKHWDRSDKLSKNHSIVTRHDNRIENLRAVSARQNQHNRSINKNSTSGVKGVCLHKPSGKWMAHVCCDSKSYYGGLHDNISDAAQAIKDLREKLHGKFANHG